MYADLLYVSEYDLKFYLGFKLAFDCMMQIAGCSMHLIMHFLGRI